MSIRVGTIKTGSDRLNYKDYVPIVVMTAKSSPYGTLGSYSVTDDEGHIMENVWQFSKLYETVPISKQRYSRWDNTIIWDYPFEKHAKLNGDETITILPEYWNWRTKGFENEYAVRYPVGMHHRHKCLGVLPTPESDTLLGVASGRKEVYFPVYTDNVKKQEKYSELVRLLDRGKKLLILEVDGPREESMFYYVKKYKVPKNWIDGKTIKITEENMRILVNDPKHSFGHGYCLASALLGINVRKL